MKSHKKELNLIDDGCLSSFLGVKFKNFNNNALELIQTYLIQRIIKALGLTEKCNNHDTPSNTTLSIDRDSKPRK